MNYIKLMLSVFKSIFLKLIALPNLNYLATIRPDTFFFRKYYFIFAQKFLFKKDQIERSKILPRLKVSEFVISDDLGYQVINSNDPILMRSINYSKQILKNKDLIQKDTLYESININPMQNEHLPILKLAVSDLLVEPIARYLGSLPILFQANIVFSPNDSTLKNSAQFIHLDRDDFRIIKCFIPLDLIDKDSGPLNFFDKKDTRAIYKRLFKQGDIFQTGTRLHDSKIIADEWNNAKMFTGDVGDIAFVDTANCFHFGSRKASKPRSIILLEYSTPFNQNLPIFKRQYFNFEEYDFEDNILATKVLGLSDQYH